jgi:hypothetical protein
MRPGVSQNSVQRVLTPSCNDCWHLTTILIHDHSYCVNLQSVIQSILKLEMLCVLQINASNLALTIFSLHSFIT